MIPYLQVEHIGSQVPSLLSIWEAVATSSGLSTLCQIHSVRSSLAVRLRPALYEQSLKIAAFAFTL